MSSISQAERWLKDRALGQNVFNFVIELREHTTDVTKGKTLIGAVGTFHLPEIGYMIHPDHAGRGYATEALQAVIPELFDRIPPLSKGGSDHIEGWTDINNRPSQRILEKCGFTYCETIADPENTIRGPSEIVIFRKARPGMSLMGLGLLPTRDPAPTPPVQ